MISKAMGRRKSIFGWTSTKDSNKDNHHHHKSKSGNHINNGNSTKKVSSNYPKSPPSTNATNSKTTKKAIVLDNNKNIHKRENDQKPSSISAATSSSASQHNIYSSASAAGAAVHLPDQTPPPLAFDPSKPHIIPGNGDKNNDTSIHQQHHPQHHSHNSSTTTHLQYPPEPQTAPLLSATTHTNSNVNDNHNNNIYVSPIPDTSTAADHLWRIQIPDLIGAIHAIQILHQAILNELSSSPYGNISLDPAEIFLCVQSASLRFQTYWEKEKKKRWIQQKRSRSKRRRPNQSNDKSAEISLSKSNSQHSHLSSANAPSVHSTETVVNTKPTINGTTSAVTSTIIDVPLDQKESSCSHLTTNNELDKTAKATAKLSLSNASQRIEDNAAHTINDNINLLSSSKVNNISNKHDAEKATNIHGDNTKLNMQANNNSMEKLSDKTTSITNDIKKKNNHENKNNATSRHPSSQSDDNNTSTPLENHYGPLNSMAEEQGNNNKKNELNEEELEEQIFQIWEESIGAVAALTNNIIGPSWKHQVKQRRSWLKEGRIASRNREDSNNKNTTDDSVSSLGMNSIKRLVNQSQQLYNPIGISHASVNLNHTGNGESISSKNHHQHSNMSYQNDVMDHNNAVSSSSSHSVGSNSQSAVNLHKNPNHSEFSNKRFLKHKKGTDSWNSQDYNNLNTMFGGANSNSPQHFPLIPEVLPAAILRFIATANESFFPPLKGENTLIRLPSKYESIGREIEKEQKWLIRRQRIGALQRMVVLSLCSSCDDDQNIDECNIELQSHLSGKVSSQTNTNHNSPHSAQQQNQENKIKQIPAWTVPGSHGPISSMMVFWLHTATTRWPEIHTYLEQDDPDFEEAIEDLIISSSVNSGEVLWGDIAEVGPIDWWYTLQVCHAASDLVMAGWKPPPKYFGPDCVIGLLSIAKKGIWLFAPNTINYEEDDVMKFDFEDTQLEAREERLAAASCATVVMSTLARLGTRGEIPVFSIESVVNCLCGILAIADLTDNFGTDIEAYPLPEVNSPDIEKNQKIKEELECERESFFSHFNSYLTDTAELLWVMVAHQASACSTVSSLLNVMNVRLSNTLFPVCVVGGTYSQNKSTILATGGAIRALGAALWGNPPQIKGIPSLRIYWARFLTVLSQISSSLYEEKSNDHQNKTLKTESLPEPSSQIPSHPFLPKAISINSTKSFIVNTPEFIAFPNSLLRDVREYTSSSLIVILEVVLALRRLVDGEMSHSTDTLCVDEWTPFIKTLSDGLLPWLDHSYAEQVSSYPFVEDDPRSQNLLLYQRIHSEVLAIFHQVHLFLTYPIRSDVEVSLANNIVMDDSCRRHIFILFLRAASPLFPADQSNSLSVSTLKAWASGGPLTSRYHTWYRIVSDILLETFAVYDDPSCGFPGGYVHSPFVQAVAFDSILECYYEHSQQNQNAIDDSNSLTTVSNDETGSIVAQCTLSSNILSDQIINLLIDFLSEVLAFNPSSFTESKRESQRIVLPSINFRYSLSNHNHSSTNYGNERSHLCKKSIEILGELFRRPCTKRSDRKLIMDTFHHFAADLSFLSRLTQKDEQEEEMIQNDFLCRLETINQIGLCFHSSFDKKSYLHETAPMVMNILWELIETYSKSCQNESDFDKVESLMSENVKKILICSSFIHLARLRTSHDGHAGLLGINNITKDSLLDIPLLGDSFLFGKKTTSELREYYRHILGYEKSNNVDSSIIASSIFLRSRILKQSIMTKAKIFEANATYELQNSSRYGQIKTILDLNLILSTVQTILRLTSHCIMSKHRLIDSNNQAESVIDQLISSCQFDICLRILCNKTTEGFLRGGIFFPFDLKLHSPEYPNHSLFNELKTVDNRIFSALIATSSCLVDEEKMTENLVLNTTNITKDPTHECNYFPKDRNFFQYVMKFISSDDCVVSMNGCRCLSLLVTYQHTFIENKDFNPENSYIDIESNLKELSLNFLAERLLKVLNQVLDISKVTHVNDQSADTPDSLAYEDKLVPLLSAMFDIIFRSTSKENNQQLTQEIKLHTVKVCSNVLRKNEYVASFQSRLLALQCAGALICTMDTDDIIVSLANIVKSKEIKKLDTDTSSVSPPQEEENVSFLDIMIDMLNRQNARLNERNSNSSKNYCSLSINQKMPKEIEELDTFAVSEHDPTAIGAWLCGDSILMFRKGSPASRYRGWLEITIRSPTSRIRKLIKLSPLIFVQNPEFPSPLWGILLPCSENKNQFDEKSNSVPNGGVITGCEGKTLTEANHQIHRHESIHGGQPLDFQSDSVHHSVDNDNINLSHGTATTSFASGEADLDENNLSFFSDIFKKATDQTRNFNDEFSHYQSIDFHEDTASQRLLQSNHDTHIHLVQNISMLKRSYSVNDIHCGHDINIDDKSSSAKSSKYDGSDEVLKSVLDVSKDNDDINSFLNLQGLLPLNEKNNNNDIPHSPIKDHHPLQQLKYSFRLRRAIDILDRTSCLQTYKIALLFAGKNGAHCNDDSGGKSGLNEENMILNASDSSLEFIEFCKGLGTYVHTRHLRHFSGGLDTSSYSADGEFAISWIDESIYSDEYTGLLFSHSMVLFHTVPLMPSGFNNRKRHVGNDNVHIVYVEDVNCLGSGISIHDMAEDQIPDKQDPVVSGQFGFVTIFVVPFSKGNLINVTVKKRSGLDVRISSALRHLVGTNIVSKKMAPTFVRQLAMRADLACRSTLQDRLGNFSNWQERLHQIRDLERYIET